MPPTPPADLSPHGAAHGAPDGAPWTAELVIARLEHAGRTLLALPNTGYTTRLRTSALDIVRTAMETLADPSAKIRPPVPDAAAITAMDQAMGWIARIPPDRYVLRRIVGARSLVSPLTDRYQFSWRRLAGVLGADHKAIQRWHAQGIAIIVASLNAG